VPSPAGAIVLAARPLPSPLSEEIQVLFSALTEPLPLRRGMAAEGSAYQVFRALDRSAAEFLQHLDNVTSSTVLLELTRWLERLLPAAAPPRPSSLSLFAAVCQGCAKVLRSEPLFGNLWLPPTVRTYRSGSVWHRRCIAAAPPSTLES
jgi:hypothetical protein